MTDARDAQTYQTVTLGEQTWLARDLNYASDDSKCYDDDPANCEIYGRLYDWEASKTACPAGWHLGSDEEWSTLIKYLDPKADPKGESSVTEESKWAGGMMKATGNLRDETGLWNYPNDRSHKLKQIFRCACRCLLRRWLLRCYGQACHLLDLY